ncbi:MAG TPA: hypothetical protein VFJ74_07325 [Gemmatimonadaceae bacterium]|nr:hypothetical protein [Gemmatimonadaceae bacterium]
MSRRLDFPSLAAVALLAAAVACGGDKATGTNTSTQNGAGCAGVTATAASSPATSLAVVGKGVVADRYTAEVAVRGTCAYTTTWGHRAAVGNAVKIWNVAGNDPVLVDSLIVSGAVTLGDVQVSDDGKLLVVATEFSPGSIVVYDLSDPAHPHQRSRFSSANTAPGVHTAEVQRVGGVLYAFLSVDPGQGFAARLVIVSLADPAAPHEVWSQAMGNPYVHDVFVRDGVLFTALWNDGLEIWDIGGAGHGGSVTNPVPLGIVATVGGHAHNVWWLHDPTTGAKRYAVVGEESPSQLGLTSSGDVHVIDVSDFTNPREVAFYHGGDNVGTHNFSVDESAGVLYAAFYNGGVRALDVRGDLGSCTAAQRAADGRCDLSLMNRELARGLSASGSVYVWGVQVEGDYVYASDMLNGLWKLGKVVR